MITRYKILPVAYLVAFIGFSFNSQKVLAQDTEGNNIFKQPAVEEQASPRSPAGAAWMSFGSMALLSAVGGGMLAAHSERVKIAGGVILGTGLVFGPSVGEIYSERWGKAALFSLGRSVSGGIGALGFMMVLGAGLGCMDSGSNCNSSSPGGIALMTIGGIAETTLIIWGIVDSYNSAEQYNEEHAKKSISLSPFVMPSTGRNGENGTAYGLAVAGNF